MERKELSVSAEDYLEAALLCMRRGERIKVTTIATRLGVSKPAVTTALGELAAKGFVSREKYGDIVLTPLGTEKAEAVYRKHRLMYDLLCKLGVSENQAEIDCCKLEHVLSDESLRCIEKFVNENF